MVASEREKIEIRHSSNDTIGNSSCRRRRVRSRLAPFPFGNFETCERVRYIMPDHINDREEEQERTVDLTQADIQSSVDIFSAQKRFDLELPLYGPYHINYTRNGR